MPRYLKWFEQAIKTANSRQESYGESKDSVANMAKIFEAIKPDYEISTEEMIVYVLISLKQARQKHKRKEDNLVDHMSYVAILADLIHGDDND